MLSGLSCYLVGATCQCFGWWLSDNSVWPCVSVSSLSRLAQASSRGSQRDAKSSKRGQVPMCKHFSTICLHYVCLFSLIKVCQAQDPRGDCIRVNAGKEIIVAMFKQSATPLNLDSIMVKIIIIVIIH